MLRPEYWQRAKELIEWCELEELKVLSTQAEKALNTRMDAYLGKVEGREASKKKARAKKLKANFKAKQL